MHDEFRARWPARGSPRRPTSRSPGKTDADLHGLPPNAEKRVRTLLVLSKVADTEGADRPDRRSRPRSHAAASGTPTTSG